MAFGQSTKTPTKMELTKIYTQAINDFINAANLKNKREFDTLFIGKRVNGLPDDFPDIDLPLTIQNTHISLITPKAAEKKQNDRKSRIYVNLIGWTNKTSAEFIFVVFSNGFDHQYDYFINYTYNAKRKEFELKKLEFKGPL